MRRRRGGARLGVGQARLSEGGELRRVERRRTGGTVEEPSPAAQRSEIALQHHDEQHSSSSGPVGCANRAHNIHISARAAYREQTA